MKLTFLLLTCFVVQTFASLNAQTVTIKKQNASLEEVIWELKQQTRFTFMYNNEDIAQIKGIDLNEKEVDVEKTVRGNGVFEIPIKHDIPIGRYLISLTFSNEGYSKDVNDCFTVIVK